MPVINFRNKTRLLLFCLIVAGTGLFLLRLVHLQIVRGQSYLTLAEENRFFRQEIPAERGVILDRFGQPLVFNRKLYVKSVQAEQVFSQKLPIERSEALRLMATDSAQVNFELRRLYQQPWVLSHVLGYTGAVSAEDLLEHEDLKVNDWLGKLGLEKVFEKQLHGQDGHQVVEINTLGQRQRMLSELEAQSGNNVKTSLDPYLSKLSYEALGANKGSVVIMDADNGQVLSLVSKPSFNANDFSFPEISPDLEQQRQQRIQDYFSDDNQVFFNRAVSGAYPPGSVFKLVTALAGLDSGELDADRSVVDEGILKVGEYEYANWYYTQYGRTEGEISLERALARSNDIYFYKAAEWTGAEKLAQTARDLGFGQATGVELSGEASGLVPDPAWKEKTLGERWYLGNTYHFGIGQGDMLVTPLQVAGMVQALANQGEKCTPHLVLTEDQRQCTGVGYDEDDINLVLAGMLRACAPGGTAYPLFDFARTAGLGAGDETTGGSGVVGEIDPAEVGAWLEKGALACKTGTAEFGGADARGYRKTHGWLAAIMDVDVEEIAKETASEAETDEKAASESAELGVENDVLLDRQSWLEKVKEQGYAQRLVIVVLVESDEAQPFKEGSHDAGPVVKAIVEGVRGE